MKFKSHLIEDQEQRLKNQSIDCQIIDISELTNNKTFEGISFNLFILSEKNETIRIIEPIGKF